MTRKVPFLISFLFALATSSSLFFDYNKIATDVEIGMDCRVSDPEERSSIQIHQYNREMVTITSGCSIKSNDSRLRISCIETENAILISVNLSGYASSDLGTWNCSDGKSYDTVTFQGFIQRSRLYGELPDATFSCIVYEDCYLSLPFKQIEHVFPFIRILKIDGGMIQCPHTYLFLNCTFMEIKFSDAGIYYILQLRALVVDAFIVQVRDYPTQPVISAQNLNSISDQGLLELICSSKLRTQPVFYRSLLSYHWKVNRLNTKDPYTCFRMKGPVLILCPESCRLKANASISVTCMVEEDGLMSNESEPFIIRLITPVEQLVRTTQVSVSAEYKGKPTQISVSAEYKGKTTQVSVSAEYKDQTGGHSTGALIGAFLGSVVAGSVSSILLRLLFIRRSVLCIKDGEGETYSGDSKEVFYINSVVDNGMRTSETEITRQYEVLDQNRVGNPQSQYTVILSKRSGHTNEAEIYELAKDITIQRYMNSLETLQYRDI